MTLKLGSRSQRMNSTCVLPWYICVLILAILGQIILKILSGNHFLQYDPCDLENGVKVMQSKLELCPSMVNLCTQFGDPRSNIS